jgi:N-acyl homoserine lactone hydrolase
MAANVDVLTYGFAYASDQGSMGWSTISLLTVGNRNIVIDTGPASRRPLLHQALKSRNLEFDDVDTVIITHLHWDHCQNTDPFRNAKILVHPTEMDYARNPTRNDLATSSYIADMLDKMDVNLVSDGDEVAEGVSILETPGHTKGHIAVLVDVGDEKVLVAGDALSDGGTVARGIPHNVFWDLEDAQDSVEKMLDQSKVFYPGHDLPFRLEAGNDISYLHGPTQIEVVDSNETGKVTAVTFRVNADRVANIDTVQKG